MILGITWANRRLSFPLQSKALRERAIHFWAWMSRWMPQRVRVLVAGKIRALFDLIDFSVFCNVVIWDRLNTIDIIGDMPIVFAMNHPGLDERLLLQWVFRNRSGGRSAFAASNLIDPLSGTVHPPDFLELMLLKGVATQRGLASQIGCAVARAPLPGSRNRAAFNEMVDLLRCGDSVIFAPEGETNPWPCLKPFKSGIARLAMSYADQMHGDVAIVPVAIHCIARGSYCRDAVLEFGEAIRVRGDAHTGGGPSGRARLMAAVRAQMEPMCDFIPCCRAPADAAAPHHNGDTELERKSALLQLHLLHLDLAASVAAALQSFGAEAAQLKLFDPVLVNSPEGFKLDEATLSAFLSEVVTQPHNAAVIWRLQTTRIICRLLFGRQPAPVSMLRCWDALLGSFAALRAAAAVCAECPENMKSIPVDFCRSFFHAKSFFLYRTKESMLSLRRAYKSFLRNSMHFYYSHVFPCSLHRQQEEQRW